MGERIVAAAFFDQAAFAAAIAAMIQAAGLSDAAAADQIGVSGSTIARVIRQGKNPDLDNLAAFADWARLPVDAFIVRSRPIATPTADDARRVIAAMRASEAAALALGLLLGGDE
jgi:transcriptional regulator with XRE-family HTH domain